MSTAFTATLPELTAPLRVERYAPGTSARREGELSVKNDRRRRAAR